MKLNEAFLNLKPNELFLLDGRLREVELEEGCIEKCLGCGEYSRPLSDLMPWRKLISVSESIKEVRERYGIDLLDRSNIIHVNIPTVPNFALSGGSNIIHYGVYDKNCAEKSAWDALELFSRNHDIRTEFIISGWSPGNNYMQEAMKKIIADNTNSKKVVRWIFYSVKPFGLQMRKEYDQFLNSGSKDINYFLKNSKYVKRVTENMKMLEDADVTYRFQFAKNMNPKNMPEENKKYQYLFSREFVEELQSFTYKDTGCTKPCNFEHFYSVGRYPHDFGTEKAEFVRMLEATIKNGMDSSMSLPNGLEIEDFPTHAMLKCDGTLRLKYGDGFGAVDIPKEFFNARANYSESAEESRKWTTLANLQGKNIF